jgi:hypothetical protein
MHRPQHTLSSTCPHVCTCQCHTTLAMPHACGRGIPNCAHAAKHNSKPACATSPCKMQNEDPCPNTSISEGCTSLSDATPCLNTLPCRLRDIGVHEISNKELMNQATKQHRCQLRQPSSRSRQNTSVKAAHLNVAADENCGLLPSKL